MRMLLAFGLVLVGVAVIAAVVLALRSMSDDQAARLAATPGYDLALPNAEELWDNVVGSLGNAGANRTRVWGVSGSVDEVTDFLDSALRGLGYEKVGGRGVDDREGVVGDYRLEATRFEATWVGLPHRVPGGRFIVSGYDFIVYTTIANGELANGGS